MFEGGNIELPATSFMDGLKQAITHKQFQQITDYMIRGMDIMKEGFCERYHYTLPEAKDQLQSLLTEIMMNDARYILDKTIHESKKEMAQLKKIKIRLDNYNSIASSKREHKDSVAKTLEFAKKTLIDTLQEEFCNLTESQGEKSMNKIREDTIKRLIQFLKKDKLVTSRSEN